jgi:hypothetical protein
VKNREGREGEGGREREREITVVPGRELKAAVDPT